MYSLFGYPLECADLSLQRFETAAAVTRRATARCPFVLCQGTFRDPSCSILILYMVLKYERHNRYYTAKLASDVSESLEKVGATLMVRVAAVLARRSSIV